MLFCKTLHKGIFIKQIFSGNFTKSQVIGNDVNMEIELSNENSDSQLLLVYESSLELFDYFYDTNLKIPFLEPRLKQDLFFTILDAKIMNIDKPNLFINKILVLLTNCGLILFTYSQTKRLFEPICSEISNISCEARDLLMYIRVEEE